MLQWPKRCEMLKDMGGISKKGVIFLEALLGAHTEHKEAKNTGARALVSPAYKATKPKDCRLPSEAGLRRHTLATGWMHCQLLPCLDHGQRHVFCTSNPVGLPEVHVSIYKGQSVKGCEWISTRTQHCAKENASTSELVRPADCSLAQEGRVTRS